MTWFSFPGEMEPSRRNLPWGRQSEDHVTQVSFLFALLFNSLTLTRRLERGRFTIATVWNGHLRIVPMCSPQSPRSQLQKQNICLKKALVRPEFYFFLNCISSECLHFFRLNEHDRDRYANMKKKNTCTACVAMLQWLTNFPWMLGFFCQNSPTSGILSMAGFPCF